MANIRPLASILVVAVIGCGGGGGDPPDAGPDASRPPDAAPDAPPGETTAVTFNVFTFDGVPESNDVVLISDNGGAWRVMANPSTGVYTADVVGPRYAIARGCIDGGIQYTEAWLYFVTLAEATVLNDLGCHSQATTVDLGGTLTGNGPNQRGQISTGSAVGLISAGATDYQLSVPAGPTDIVARLYPNVSATQPRPTQRLYIARDVAVAGPTTHDIDFTNDGFDPEPHTFDVTGGAGIARNAVALYNDNMFGFGIESNRESTNVFHAVPANRLVAGDRLVITQGSVDGRSISRVVDAPADLTGDYGPAFTPPEPTLSQSDPIVRLAGTLPHVDGADLYSVDAFWIDDATFDAVYWAQIYSAGYAGADPIAYDFPDLNGIGDWDIGLPPGQIDWSQTVTTSALNAQLPTFLDVDYVVGDTILNATASGTIQP